MFAAQNKLDNVCAIVDFNHVQLDGTIEEIKNLDNLPARWNDFGWKVIELDGHNVDAVVEAFKRAARSKERPTVLIAHTVKRQGRFIHGKSMRLAWQCSERRAVCKGDRRD